MKILTGIFGFLFLLAGLGFLLAGAGLMPRSSIHEVYQVLHYTCAVMCFGFMALLWKGE